MEAEATPFGEAFASTLAVAPLRKDELRAALAEVGVALEDVALDGLRVSLESFQGPGTAGNAAMVLVVTTYAKDENGKRYFDLDTKEVATETRRFHLYGAIHLSTD